MDLLPYRAAILLTAALAVALTACDDGIGRVDGLPVERFDEYPAGEAPPHPWRLLGGGSQVAIRLEAAAESPFIANRITGKGIQVDDADAAAGAGAGVAVRFPPPPAGPLYLGFDAQVETGSEGFGLAAILNGKDGPLLRIELRGDGQALLAVDGGPATGARLASPGWVHLALALDGTGEAVLQAVQGRWDARPQELARRRLPAGAPPPRELAVASLGPDAATGRWRLDNLCMAGAVGADRRRLWPFDQAPLERLRASPRQVFAYYYPVYGSGLAAGDPGLSWYARTRLNPSWAAQHRPDRAAGGAELLYTPLPQPPLPPGTTPEEALARMADGEVALGRSLGLDGFLVDFQAFPRSDNGETTFLARSFAIMDAAQRLDPGFRILPAVYSGSGVHGVSGEADAGRSAEDYAASPVIARLAAHPAALRLPDGRLVLSMWLSERHSPAWWGRVLAALEARGIRVAFLPQFNSFNRLADFAPLAWGMSHWGPRTPDPYDWIVRARPLTGTVVQPVVFQDCRTRGTTYWEADASRTFLSLWRQAIGQGADWVFIHTWSDYTEQAQAPSTAIGFALHDLNAYHLQWFKLGAPPAIVRDALYYVHRRAHSSVAPAQGPAWSLRGPAGAAPVDEIELIGFLAAPGELAIAIGGQRTVLQAPAGLSILRAPLPVAGGVPVFSLERDGRPVLRGASRHAILGRVEFQNPLYHAGSIHASEELP